MKITYILNSFLLLIHFRQEEGECDSMTMCDFVIGDRVQDSGDGHRGTVLFVGSVPPTKVWPVATINSIFLCCLFVKKNI